MSHKETALANLFYRALEKIHDNKALTTIEKIDSVYFLMNKLFLELTKVEKTQFTTFFARLVYVFQKWDIEKKIQYWVHRFRRERWKLNNPDASIEESSTLLLGYKATAESVQSLLNTSIPPSIINLIPPEDNFRYKEVKISAFRSRVRVIVIGDNPETCQLVARDEEQPTEIVYIQYNIVDLNQNFNQTISIIKSIFRFPVSVNLIDVAIDENGVYRPKALVVDPDFLIDVSAVSECFKDFGTEPLLYLLKKFLPFQTSKPLMLGNIANFFLDELLTNPSASFQETFPKVFQLNPLAFLTFNDSEVKEIMQKSRYHFQNLKRYVVNEFSKFDILPQDCFLEPSFYSEKYGLQGRLDAFYRSPENAAIIELKSGKAYKPNRHGISHNHFTQTLLYDLIVRSVFGKNIEPVNYIFYSGIEQRQLRYAPVIKAQQNEALQVRNQLLAIEKSLEKLEENIQQPVLQKLNPNRFPNVTGFVRRDLNTFASTFQQLDDTEQTYFTAFTAFIAREHRLAKTGIEGIERQNGLSALWQDSFKDKERNFSIFSYLEIRENRVREEEPLLIFNKTPKTSKLANFRVGDIAVLYPYQNMERPVLKNQIFKCSVIEITEEKVIVRLRYKQYNISLFESYQYWNLEHDMMDSSFSAMYRGLFAFAQTPKPKRELLFTVNPPRKPDQRKINQEAGLTQEQQAILEKAINAQDYFLLWGPPGTGKTSKMIRHLSKWILEETEENLLLLAYTNRAVDEICEAIETIYPAIKQDYLRIGSRYSTALKFQEQLLSVHSSKIKTRAALRQLIESKRIFVGTIASFANKGDLFKLKKFDQVIIDEASQILEPMMVGLLPLFKKFILVGDHKQLPAVVIQEEDLSKTDNKDLHAIGLEDLRNSFFERLYKRCEAERWDWALAKLSHQGRMHQDIMDFPNHYFYNGFLKILPANISHAEHQKAELMFGEETTSSLSNLLAQRRTIFFNTDVDTTSTQKTNQHEANLIVTIIKTYQDLYKSMQRELSPHCIGIITPFRAQIAQIQDSLANHNIATGNITIDTVERYQGGARDIIIISLCTNDLQNLETLISVSSEGVDRKLNVALTRAREQVIVLGNEQILKNNPIYHRLINDFKTDLEWS